MLPKKMQTKIFIRPLRLEDLEEIMLIEPTAFGQNHWSRQSFAAELNKPEGVYFVAQNVTTKQLLGYSGFWLLDQEAHITTLAVHENYRGQYIGERLLVNNIIEARRCGALRLTLEVRASNEAAQKLYSKYGFKTVNARPHYYQDNFESALILWSDDVTTAQFNALFQNKLDILAKKEEELAGFSYS